MLFSMTSQVSSSPLKLKLISYLNHTTRGLKIFVTVTLKEGLVGTIPAKPSFGMMLTIELFSVVLPDYVIVGVISKKT